MACLNEIEKYNEKEGYFGTKKSTTTQEKNHTTTKQCLRWSWQSWNQWDGFQARKEKQVYMPVLVLVMASLTKGSLSTAFNSAPATARSLHRTARRVWRSSSRAARQVIARAAVRFSAIGREAIIGKSCFMSASCAFACTEVVKIKYG